MQESCEKGSVRVTHDEHVSELPVRSLHQEQAYDYNAKIYGIQSKREEKCVG